MIGDYYNTREWVYKKILRGLKVPLVAKYDNVFDFKRFKETKSIQKSLDYKYLQNERCVIDGFAKGCFRLTFERNTSLGKPLQILLDWDTIFYGFNLRIKT